MVEERLIDPLEPLGRGLGGSGVAQMRESQARPAQRGQATFMGGCAGGMWFWSESDSESYWS